MAPYHGKKSSAFWDTAAISTVTGWTCNMTCPAADGTSRHDSAWGRVRWPGEIGGTATVTAKLSGDNLPQQGATAVLELLRTLTDSAKGYAGTATCTGASPSVDKDSVDVVAYEFQWDSTVSATVSEGTP